MRKSIGLIVGLTLVASPAFAQVRPQDCRPVLPVMDKAAAAVPMDVVAEPAAPQVAAGRRFVGLPLLFPALLAAGGIGAIASHNSSNNDSNTPAVSPA